jgi:hypothetical protein
MKQLKNWTIGLAAFALAAVGAYAGDWHRCGDYTTGGGAKEVPANYQNVRRVQIQCIDGGVNIQTLWVRNGGQKKEHRVARSLGRGQTYEIELGGQDTTGFRISDSGNGRYRVNVLTDPVRHDDHHGHHGHHDDWDDRDYRGRDYYRDYDRDYDRRPPPPPRHHDDTPSWWPW